MGRKLSDKGNFQKKICRGLCFTRKFFLSKFSLENDVSVLLGGALKMLYHINRCTGIYIAHENTRGSSFCLKYLQNTMPTWSSGGLLGTALVSISEVTRYLEPG